MATSIADSILFATYATDLLSVLCSSTEFTYLLMQISSNVSFLVGISISDFISCVASIFHFSLSLSLFLSLERWLISVAISISVFSWLQFMSWLFISVANSTANFASVAPSCTEFCSLHQRFHLNCNFHQISLELLLSCHISLW